MKILDAGCGRGDLIKEIYNSEDEFYGIDILPIFIADAKKRISFRNCHFKVCSLEKLDFPDNFFDVIYCMAVLEHVVDFNKALNNLIRTLKVGGELVILVPHPFSEKLLYILDPSLNSKVMHRRVIKPSDLKKILIQNNFRIIYLKKRDFFNALMHFYRAYKKLPYEEQSGLFKFQHANLITKLYQPYSRLKNNVVVRTLNTLLAQILPKNYLIKAIKTK